MEQDDLPPTVDPRLQTLQDLLGYRFRNPALALQALRHASVGGADRTDNERLEFLGDAFLGLTVAEMLYARHPGAREGELTERRSKLVSRAHLSSIARTLRLEHLLELRPPPLPGSILQSSVLAGALEALIGAVFLDGGADAASEMTRRLLSQIGEVDDRPNPKTELQHLTQLLHGHTPVYRTTQEWVHSFGRTFCVMAEVHGTTFPPGWGRSKREAEQNAAREALLGLREVNPQNGA